MVCFRDSTISIIPVVVAMVSNFTNPLRNVLSKRIMGTVSSREEKESTTAQTEGGEMQKLIPSKNETVAVEEEQIDIDLDMSSRQKDSFEVFFTLSLHSSYLMVPIWIIVNITNHGFVHTCFRGSAFLNLLFSGILHAAYNLSSFGFLSRVRRQIIVTIS